MLCGKKLCLFFSTYSFLFSTIFIVLMQLLGPFNIINELIFTNNKNQQKDTKIYSYKSLVKKYEKYDIHHSLSTIIKSKRKRKSKNDGKYESKSKSKSNGKNKGEDTNKFIHNYNTREDNYYSTYDKSDEHHDLAQISNHMNSIQSSSYKKDSVSFYSSSHSTNMEIIKYDHGKKQTYDEKNHSNSFSSSTNTDIDNNYNNIYKMEKKNIKNMSDEMMKKKTKKDQKKKKCR